MRPKHNQSYKSWVDTDFAGVLTAKSLATTQPHPNPGPDGLSHMWAAW